MGIETDSQLDHSTITQQLCSAEIKMSAVMASAQNTSKAV
jgi:hypothetical protein